MSDISAIDRFPGEAPRLISTLSVSAPVSSSAQASTAAVSGSQVPAAVTSGSDMRFEIDNDTSRVVVRFRDPDTGETVRQIPSEVLLRVAAMIAEARGGTVDASA